MSIPYVLPREFEDLLNSSKVAPTKRVQIYQTAEQPGPISPSNYVRFNIPSDCIADFRDSYVTMDIYMTGNAIAQTPSTLTWQALTAAGPFPVNAPTGTFQLEYKGFQNGTPTGLQPLILVTASNTDIANYLLTIPTFKQDFNVYTLADFNQKFTVANTLSILPAPSLVITCLDKSIKFLDNNGAAIYIRVVNTNVRDSVTGAFLDIIPISVVNGTPAFPRTEYGSGAFIDRVQIEFNSETFCEIENYNRLWAIYDKLKLVDHRRCSGTLLSNEVIFKETYFEGGKRVEIPLWGCGILNNIFPFMFSKNIQLRITLRLSDPRICLVNSVGNDGTQSYYANNCQFQYHQIYIDEAVANRIKQKMAGEGLVYGFENYLSFSDSITGTTFDKNVDFNVKSFLGILGVMQEQNFYGDWTKFHKTDSFIRNNIQSYRLKVGSDYYPKNTIDTLPQNLANLYSVPDVVQPFSELMRFFGLFQPLDINPDINDEATAALGYYSNYHSGFYLDSYISNLYNYPSFIMAISTDSEAREVDKSYHDMSSGINATGQNSITFELRNLQLQGINTLFTYGKFQALAILDSQGITYVK
jgi:hypothetical protein